MALPRGESEIQDEFISQFLAIRFRQPPSSQGTVFRERKRIPASGFGIRASGKTKREKEKAGVWPCLLCLSLSYEAESIS